MIEHALLYYLQDAPTLDSILRAAGYPPPDAPAAAAEATRTTAMIPGVKVELEVLPPEGLRFHLDALHKFLTERCEVGDPELPGRLKNARRAVGVTLDPGYGPNGTEFVRAAARSTGALLFFEADGSIQDGMGNRLAEPARVSVEPVDEEEGGGAPDAPEDEPTREQRVAKRALILAGLAWRSWLEAQRPSDAEAQLSRFVDWLEQHELFAEMEGPEAALADGELGSWREADVRTQAWGIEGAAVLAWALGLLELPAHDVKVEPPAVVSALGLFSAKPTALAAQLRPDEEIAAMGRRLLGIHWRIREFLRAPGLFDFEEFSRRAWFGGFDLQGIATAHRDLAIGGMPIEYAAEKEVQLANSIAAERYRAIAWLEGKQEERLRNM